MLKIKNLVVQYITMEIEAKRYANQPNSVSPPNALPMSGRLFCTHSEDQIARRPEVRKKSLPAIITLGDSIHLS